MSQKSGESLTALIDREKKIFNELNECFGYYLSALKDEAKMRDKTIERFRQYQLKWIEYREIRKKFE